LKITKVRIFTIFLIMLTISFSMIPFALAKQRKTYLTDFLLSCEIKDEGFSNSPEEEDDISYEATAYAIEILNHYDLLVKRDIWGEVENTVNTTDLMEYLEDKGKDEVGGTDIDIYKIYFIFEAEMGGGGIEGMSRFIRPRDMIFLCKTIKSKWVGACFDFEHVLSQNIDPKKEIESIPYGMANYIKLLHLGFPTSLAPAHMPIPLGSKEQLWLYERLYELRKKGMNDAWMIFERAGAPREKVILVLRLIKEFLEKDTHPKELPLEFFGMKPGGPEIAREEVTIREHVMDPLKGMLAVPEEEYTFLSRTAAERGKAEEWKKERYK